MPGLLLALRLAAGGPGPAPLLRIAGRGRVEIRVWRGVRDRFVYQVVDEAADAAQEGGGRGRVLVAEVVVAGIDEREGEEEGDEG
jgi:hypothetical protein